MYLAKKFPPSSKFERTNKLFSIEKKKKFLHFSQLIIKFI